MTRMKWLTWTENWIKKVFLKMCDMAKSGFETLSLTMILIFNLFFIVFLLLAVCTVLVLTGVDGGFLYSNGQISIGSVLCFIYAVCILIAISMVVMIRTIFILPLRRNIAAMETLAGGDFSVRLTHSEKGYTPREMLEFEQSFNKAAEELGGTEILRKDFINNFSHEFKTPIVSISGFADLLLEEQLPRTVERTALLAALQRAGAIRTEQIRLET